METKMNGLSLYIDNISDSKMDWIMANPHCWIVANVVDNELWYYGAWSNKYSRDEIMDKIKNLGETYIIIKT